MRISQLECLGAAARDLLTPHGVRRVSFLGDLASGADLDDLHLLVEFGQQVQPVGLDEWLRLQRAVGERCGTRVELVSVNGLTRRVAEENVSVTVLYEAGGSHG